MSSNDNTPAHVAIIMDGNGRWARSRGMDRVSGHMQGVESVREAIRSSVRCGVRYLTLYVFSAENRARPAAEVDYLMELMCRSVVGEVDELVEQGVKVVVIGERSDLSEKVTGHLAMIEDRTAGGDKLTVLLAFNYGARQEIARAARRLAGAAMRGEVDPEAIGPDSVASQLYTAGYPDPDLLIRTGGDQRLSNFLLWQSAYTEFYFTDRYWPDFDSESFDRAIEAYGARERRYGLIENTETASQ